MLIFTCAGLEQIRMHETFQQEYTEKQVTWQWTVDSVTYGVEGIEVGHCIFACMHECIPTSLAGAA